MSDLDFLTSKIGWKDDWKTNKESVVRVQLMKVISNQVVLILTSIIFKSLQSCFDFLSYLIPHGHSLPLDYNDFRYQLRTTKSIRDKLKKRKSKGEEEKKEYENFLAEPFFLVQNPCSSDSGPSCSQCQQFELQLETLESEKAILNENLRELRTLFDNEKSKTCSLTSKVEDLEADISKLKKSAAGLKSGIARARVCKNLEPSTATNQSVSTSSIVKLFMVIFLSGITVRLFLLSMNTSAVFLKGTKSMIKLCIS